MTAAPKGMRLHLGVFGRRNAGKSSLVNFMAGQDVSIVSERPGTTTDPVEKSMEFLPLGPVVIIDTAGIDDAGDLGELRSARARAVIERTDLALLVFDGQWGAYEQELFDIFSGASVPVVGVAAKADLHAARTDWGQPSDLVTIAVSPVADVGLEDLRQAVLAAAPAAFIESPVIVRDLVPAGSTVLLVTPIDKEAPRGRLILPQVQTLRDLLDGDCVAVVCKEDAVAKALSTLKVPPALAVTDSQAFREVAAQLGDDIPLTGFSILFARAKGDLVGFAKGAAAIDRLRDGDQVLVAESCTHHREDDDIGRVKLPALVRKKSGAELEFSFASGHDFPADLAKYALILHCGACMTNRRAVLSRQARAAAAGVPAVNYGMAIAHCLGLLGRALAPFPEALAAVKQ